MILLLVLTCAIVQCTALSIPPFFVKSGELLEMSNKLRQEDINKAGPSQITINYQDHTQSGNGVDNAAKPFFTRVDDKIFNNPSYSQFIDMMNNFYKETGIAEPRVSLKEERQEISAFLDTILASKPWQKLYAFLHEKKHPFAKDPNTFRCWINQLWFMHYSRAKGKPDTSGFEHVFMGEEKCKKGQECEVSGLHNWVRFYMLENNSTENLDYKGFIVKRGNVMAALKFSWGEAFKKTGSIIIGTSPEYEMALYTMCFLSRRGKELCEVELDGCPLSITSYEMIQNDKVHIGTVFPTAGKMTDTCAKR